MKWRAYPEDVLPMWVAEMDAPLAEPIREAIEEALGRGDTGYPVAETYVTALAEFAGRRWGWSIDPGRTAIVPDVMLGIVELLKLVTGPGDAVVVNPPVYPPFYAFVEHMDRRIVGAPLSPLGRLDFDRLAHAFAEATRGGRRAAYLLCSPHNPTGTVHTAAELATVAEIAAQYDVRVVVDEIHAPLVLPGNVFTPYLSVPGSGSGFSVMSASKGWNLAGLKAALVVAGEAAVKDLRRMPEEVSHGPSHLGVIAHVAALRDGGPWLDELLADLDQNRLLLRDLLAERLPRVGFRVPEATYLAWLDCRELGLGDDPAAFFLAYGRVAFSSGPAFGDGGQGRVRMNIATSPALIAEGVDRMLKALDAVPS
jgi:cysteine-S-conjugate beta-lyase